MVAGVRSLAEPGHVLQWRSTHRPHDWCGPIVHLLYTACNGLMVLVSVFGAVAIALGDHECPCHQCPCLFPNYLFQDGTFSKISAVLSLATNILATALIAYKAW